MKEVKIGVIGFGTVGVGVVECIQKNASIMSARTGIMPVVTKIADLDITSDRGISIDAPCLTTDYKEVVSDSDVQIVVELIGGTTLAKRVIVESLNAGKAVVTANKALLAEHGAELYATAQENGVDLYYEASVAGGIPIIKTLREGLSGNGINTIMGIMNGTCNYILTRMENEKIPFEVILPEAQAAGYAEAVPSLDVDGWDTAHKTVILASLAYGANFDLEDVNVQGICDIQLKEIDFAAALGYKIKLLSIIKQTAKGVELNVQPTLIPNHTLLGQVSDVFNAVWLNGDTVDDVMLYGRGAGRAATASAVVADIMDVALNLKNGCAGRIPAFKAWGQGVKVVPKGLTQAQWYLRLPYAGEAIAFALADAGISFEDVSAKAGADGELILLTCLMDEATIQAALHEIGHDVIRLRVENMT